MDSSDSFLALALRRVACLNRLRMHAFLQASRSAWFLAGFALPMLLAGIPSRAGDGEAVSSDWFIKNWSVDDGFPGSSVYLINQTIDGYLWLSTQDRFVRFDGVRFVPIGPDARGIMPLPGRRHERLWCGDARGALLLREGSSFRSVPLPPGAKGPVQSASEDPDGTTWIQSGGEIYGWREGQWEVPPEIASVPKGVAWTRDAAARRRWCILNHQLGYFEAGKIHPAWSPQAKEDGRPEALAARRGGGVWCVIRLPNEELHLRSFPTDGTPSLSMPIPWKGGVLLTDLIVDRRGDFWISASTHGALRLKPDATWEVFNARSGFGTDHVRGLFEDSEGNIWIPTDGNGVFRLTRRAFRTYGVSDGLTTDNVYAVAPAKAGGVWIGTHGSGSEGLFRWREGQITRQALMGPYAWSAHEDPSGDVWAGNFESGLFRLHQGVAVGVVPGSLSSVFAICDDGEGGLWIGGSGLARVRQGQSERVAGFPPKMEVTSLTRDAPGTVWIGTRKNGLYSMNDGAFTRFTSADGLASDEVLCLYADNQDTLWIGTMRGLTRRKDGRFFSITRAGGLASDTVSGLAEDRLGNFWMHSSEGISRMSKKALEDFFEESARSVFSISYGREDGLVTRASTVGTQPRVCQDRDGRMWFATLKGAAVIDPATMPVNTNPPPVVLEEVRVNGVVQNQSLSSPDSAEEQSKKLKTQIDRDGRMLFPPGSRGIEFNYTANSLMAPEKVRFKYRLAGLHPDWVDAGNRRQAVFDRLTPGPYRFEVAACNNDGVWNEAGADFAFAVLPFFWQTLWFKFLAGAAVLLAFAMLVRHFATRRLQRQLVLAEQQAAVERERSRISQDMHDDLGARLTKISLLGELATRSLGEPSDARTHLQMLSGLARETAESLSELIWTVKPANDTLRSLANHLCQHTDEFLRETNIRCRFDFPEQLPDLTIAADARQQLVLTVKEALTNAVKHSAATELRLGLLVEPEVLSITISDNGRGLREEVRVRSGGGNGLANMRERLANLGGQCEIASQPGHGTEVSLKMPLL